MCRLLTDVDSVRYAIIHRRSAADKHINSMANDFIIARPIELSCVVHDDMNNKIKLITAPCDGCIAEACGQPI